MKTIEQKSIIPWDIEVLAWCPGGSVLSQGEKASLTLVGHPSSDGVTIKIPYRADVLLHQPALQPIFSYWIG